MSRLVLSIYLGLLVFAPLAFGSVETWSRAVLCLGSVLALSLHMIDCRRKKRRFYRVPGLVPLSTLLLLVALQLVPLPQPLMETLRPLSLQLHWAQALKADSSHLWLSLSPNLKATLHELLRYGGYLAFYVLSIQLMARREGLKKILYLVAVFAAIFSLLGIFQYLLPSEKILWILRDWPSRAPHPFATYINGNHYAGLMLMLFPVLLALTLATRLQLYGRSFREKFTEALSHPKFNSRVLLGSATLLAGCTVFLSLSRGGTLSLLASSLFFMAMMLMNREMRSRATLVGGIGLMTLMLVGVVGWGSIFERFDSIRDASGQLRDERPVYWSDSLEIISDFSLLGTGAGTFRDVYPAYRSVKHQILVDHAHNDYLEQLVETGIVGAGLLAWFAVLVLRQSRQQISKRRSLRARYLYLGSLSGLVGIGFHSLTDFNLRLGANGLYFFFLIALMVSACHTRLNRHSGASSLLPRADRPGLKLILSSFFALATASLLYGSALLGELSFSGVKKASLTQLRQGGDLEAARTLTEKAAWFDPLEGSYRFALASLNDHDENPLQGRSYLVQAVRRLPTDAQYVQQLALATGLEGDRESADRLFEAGITLDQSNPARHQSYGLWLAATGRMIQAAAQLQRAMEKDGSLSSAILVQLEALGHSIDELGWILPASAQAWLNYGELLQSRNLEQQALFAHRRTLVLADGTDGDVFWRLYRFFKELNNEEKTFEVIRKAVELFPNSAEFRSNAGLLYEKRGLRQQAMQEYRSALLIKPGMGWVRTRLAKLETSIASPLRSRGD